MTPQKSLGTRLDVAVYSLHPQKKLLCTCIELMLYHFEYRLVLGTNGYDYEYVGSGDSLLFLQV